MANEISGWVERIEVQKQDEHLRRSAGATYAPVKVKAVIALADGRTVYVSVQVGEWATYNAGGGGWIEAFHASKTEEAVQASGGWSWMLPEKSRGTEVVDGSNFGLAHTPIPHPAIWAGDEVTVRGTIEEKMSKAGNAYLCVTRAKLVEVTKTEVA